MLVTTPINGGTVCGTTRLVLQSSDRVPAGEPCPGRRKSGHLNPRKRPVRPARSGFRDRRTSAGTPGARFGRGAFADRAPQNAQPFPPPRCTRPPAMGCVRVSLQRRDSPGSDPIDNIAQASDAGTRSNRSNTPGPARGVGWGRRAGPSGIAPSRRHRAVRSSFG
jgi:hypothetical protein